MFIAIVFMHLLEHIVCVCKASLVYGLWFWPILLFINGVNSVISNCDAEVKLTANIAI